MTPNGVMSSAWIRIGHNPGCFVQTRLRFSQAGPTKRGVNVTGADLQWKTFPRERSHMSMITSVGNYSRSHSIVCVQRESWQQAIEAFSFQSS